MGHVFKLFPNFLQFDNWNLTYRESLTSYKNRYNTLFFFLIRGHGCSLVQSGEYLLIPSCDRRESIVVNISKFSLVKNSKLVHTYIEKNFYSRSENNSEI